MIHLNWLRLVLALACLLLAAGCYPQGYDPAFPTMEPVRDLETVGNLRPELLWQSDLDDGLYSTPVVVGEVLYVRGWEQVYALNRENGELRWVFETDASLTGNLAVADGAVYAGSTDDGLFALDAGSGELLWRYEPGFWVYDPVASNGVIYFATADEHVQALDGSTGELIWRVHLASLDSNVVMADGIVFVGGFINALYALDADSGELLWPVFESDNTSLFPLNPAASLLATGPFMWKVSEFSFDHLEADDSVDFASTQSMSIDEDSPYTSLCVADGVVYLAAYTDGVYAFDAIAGQLLWHFDDSQFGYLAGAAFAPAVVDGRVYVAAGNRNYNNGVDGSVHTLDAASGELLWHYRTAGAQTSTPAVAGGVVYATAYDGHLYAFNPASGDLFWYYDLGGPTPYASAVVDGVIYLATSNGLLALRSVAGE